ncbi:hypothetical protein BLNAU_14735 [Blattamonas nauphoetae]|uniref:Uncharacterized protein n=1 Tax=Blattamonas nauphoetae TaxID=2049346 RepID=A0ABQ9XFX6_9EUKA|nr:hypothetical protein BLNAU_14735 [Blattamonas nauphoetae]
MLIVGRSVNSERMIESNPLTVAEQGDTFGGVSQKSLESLRCQEAVQSCEIRSRMNRRRGGNSTTSASRISQVHSIVIKVYVITQPGRSSEDQQWGWGVVGVCEAVGIGRANEANPELRMALSLFNVEEKVDQLLIIIWKLSLQRVESFHHPGQLYSNVWQAERRAATPSLCSSNTFTRPDSIQIAPNIGEVMTQNFSSVHPLTVLLGRELGFRRVNIKDFPDGMVHEQVPGMKIEKLRVEVVDEGATGSIRDPSSLSQLQNRFNWKGYKLAFDEAFHHISSRTKLDAVPAKQSTACRFGALLPLHSTRRTWLNLETSEAHSSTNQSLYLRIQNGRDPTHVSERAQSRSTATYPLFARHLLFDGWFSVLVNLLFECCVIHEQDEGIPQENSRQLIQKLLENKLSATKWDDLSLEILPLVIGMQFVRQLREGHDLETQLLFHQQPSEDYNIITSMIEYLHYLSQFLTNVLNQR